MASNAERILVVENDPDISDVIVRQALQPMGYQVTVAQDGSTAIRMAVQAAPDLVIANQEENARPALEALAARGVPVLVSLALIRLCVRVLQAVFPQSQLMRTAERTISWLAWGAVVLWITGVLPLVLDDVLELTPGDLVPVDGRVLDSRGLELDESSLTGESEPVPKVGGDEVLSGSAVAAGTATVLAVRVGEVEVRVGGADELDARIGEHVVFVVLADHDADVHQLRKLIDIVVALIL